MLTVISEPRRILPFHVKGTSFAEHPFFEASSIRRIGNLYYFIYSSLHGHELCYALSRYPDRDFEYAGVIVSNGDIGIKGRKARDRLNTTGTNHGSIEEINGQWYVFYHRNTNRTAYSRQACAEQIFIDTKSLIQQAEITSCGLNGAPLPAEGKYPAAICCNLTHGRMPHQGNGVIHKKIPYIRGRDGECTVIAVNNTKIMYKYFSFPGTQTELKILLRSHVSGKITVYVSDEDQPVGIINVKAVDDWRAYSVLCRISAGIRSLTFHFKGKGSIELREFELKPTGSKI